MNLKVLFMFIIYYSVMGLFFIAGEGIIEEDFQANFSLNSSEIQGGEVEVGGFFTTGVSFGRFFKFTFLGLGLPADTPKWFSTFFVAWQFMITTLAVGFIIASIWDG